MQINPNLCLDFSYLFWVLNIVMETRKYSQKWTLFLGNNYYHYHYDRLIDLLIDWSIDWLPWVMSWFCLQLHFLKIVCLKCQVTKQTVSQNRKEYILALTNQDNNNRSCVPVWREGSQQSFVQCWWPFGLLSSENSTHSSAVVPNAYTVC